MSCGVARSASATAKRDAQQRFVTASNGNSYNMLWVNGNCDVVRLPES